MDEVNEKREFALTNCCLLTDTSQISAIMLFEEGIEERLKETGYKEIKQSDLMIKQNEKGKKIEYRIENGRFPFDYVENGLKIAKMMGEISIIFYKEQAPLIIIYNLDNPVKGKITGFAIAPKISTGDN